MKTIFNLTKHGLFDQIKFDESNLNKIFSGEKIPRNPDQVIMGLATRIRMCNDLKTKMI